MNETIDRYYTLKDIERVTGIAYRTLRDQMTGGKLPAYKIAGKWRVKESDLKAFLNAGKPSKAAENK